MVSLRSLLCIAGVLQVLASGETRSATKQTLPPIPRSDRAIRSCRGGGINDKKVAVVTSLILAMNSGFVNGCTLSGFINGAKQATAAVTGGWTNSAIGWAAGTSAFATQAKLILCFIGGSCIASLYNPNPVLFDFAPGSFRPSLMTCSVLLFASHHFAQKGNNNFLAMCAIASGIQNSVTSVSTGNLCRTTHYTGISSDMGTFLGQYLRGNKDNLFKLQVFASLAACFWLGGAIAYYVANNMGASALLIPAIVYALMSTGFVHKLLGAYEVPPPKKPAVPEYVPPSVKIHSQ